MTDRQYLANEYQRAGIDLPSLGLTVEHYRRADGVLCAGLPLDDWLIVAQVFTARESARCNCPRPIANGHTCAKCGRSR